MQNQNNLTSKYDQYRQRYNNECNNWRSQPVADRKTNDPYCIIVFFILTALFLVIGGYYMATQNSYSTQLPDQLGQINVFTDFAAPIIVCSFVSILISFLYIFLIKLAPVLVVYSLIFITLGILGLLCILGIATGNIGLTISMAIILIVYGIILGCFRNKIKMGIVLVKVATKFFSDKPIVFVTPFLKIGLTFVFAIFWLYSFSLMQDKMQYEQLNNQDTSLTLTAQLIWVLLWLFFTFFFYYMMVFTIAVTCSFWYYDVKDKNPIATAYGWFFRSAFGSVTFAALVISIVTFAKMVIDSKRRNNKNVAVAVCLCIVSCILRQIQALLQILNHFSIICMSVTGQNFIDSAKSTIGILCSDFPLFSVSRLITNLLVFWGVILSVGLPSFLGILWVANMQDGQENAGSVLLMIFFSTIMISGIIFSILVQSISSIFVFYCFDKRFKELGFESHNIPAEIHDVLYNAGNQANQSYAKIQEN